MAQDMVTTTLKLPARLNEALREVAAEDHRSINATIVVVLEQFIESRNHQARVAEIGSEIATKHAELLRRLAQ
jgi:hypothetical protein